MSDIKIQPSATGSGTVTITAPTTNTARVITLPDSAGTLLDENSSVPSANLTGTVVDARISALTASKLTGDLPAISGVNVTNVHAVNSGRKNWIINGDFQISQRGAYTSATGLTSSWTYYLDRFKTRINSISGNLTHKVDQTVDGKLTDTVRLDATSTASGYINLLQQVEDLQKLKGQSVTFSAWVKSNNTNAKLVLHRDGSNAQTATTHTGGGGWELLTATVTLATTITTVGLYCGILANATGNVSITSGDYFEIAFVQLELGSVATNFEHRSYGEELALCQRYFEKHTVTGYHHICMAQAMSGTNILFTLPFLVQKRIIPTMSFSAVAGFTAGTAAGSHCGAGTAISSYSASLSSMRGGLDVTNSSLSAGNASMLQNLGTSGLTSSVSIDAEL